jgi:tight adherence protein C
MGLSPEIVFYVNVVAVGLLAALLVWAIVGRSKAGRRDEVSRRLMGSESATRGGRGIDLADAPGWGGVESVARVLAKPLEGSEYERNKVTLKLAQAGFRREEALVLFLASRIALAVVGIIAGIMLSRHFTPPEAKWWEGLAWPLGGLCLGFYLPQFLLSYAANQRALKITRGMPDALDMLVVMVEAGLGLDAAIQRCAQELRKAYPHISDELRLAARETQMGLSRAEAMQKMALRTGVPEMQTLVAILTQAERFGTSVATALRTQAAMLRVKRRQKAEEAAAKTAVKLIFPLVLFIFPTIFIVLAGPAAMKIGAAFPK